jgi:hypothetical protein
MANEAADVIRSMLDGIGARYTVKYHHRMAPLEYAVFESMRE